MSRSAPVEHHRVRRNYNRLGILLVCLILTVAVTAFTIWYNLNHLDSSSFNLFNFISNHLEKGFQDPEPLLNK